MELRNVGTFLRVAELRSFSRAAEQLGYSQSAVSAQIQQLETELGTPLFDRINKTIRLTDAGQEFSLYARQLVSTAEDALRTIQKSDAAHGTLRIAFADSLCSAFLPTLLEQYHKRCPQVELVLRTCTTTEMFSLLDRNEIDLAYTLDLPLTQHGLIHALDKAEPVCFVAPAKHPLARKNSVSVDELVRQEFLLTEHGMSYRDVLEQFLATKQLSVRPLLELGSVEMLCRLVERGMGLSFVPECVARPHLQDGTLVYLNVPDCQIEVWRQLFYHKDKWVTPQMKSFVALVQELDP
jgi:DNA-binding transcriptional LysR family regulator